MIHIVIIMVVISQYKALDLSYSECRHQPATKQLMNRDIWELSTNLNTIAVPTRGVFCTCLTRICIPTCCSNNNRNCSHFAHVPQTCNLVPILLPEPAFLVASARKWSSGIIHFPETQILGGGACGQKQKYESFPWINAICIKEIR